MRCGSYKEREWRRQLCLRGGLAPQCPSERAPPPRALAAGLDRQGAARDTARKWRWTNIGPASCPATPAPPWPAASRCGLETSPSSWLPNWRARHQARTRQTRGQEQGRGTQTCHERHVPRRQAGVHIVIRARCRPVLERKWHDLRQIGTHMNATDAEDLDRPRLPQSRAETQSCPPQACAAQPA